MWMQRNVLHWPQYVGIIFTLLATLDGRCTTVLLYRDSTRIVVGADSLSHKVKASNLARSFSYCKIRKTGAVYVSMSGLVSASSNGFDAYRTASSAIAHSNGLAESAKEFARLSIAPLQEAVSHQRQYHADLYDKETKRGGSVALQAFFMSYEKSVPSFAIVILTISEHSPGKDSPGKDLLTTRFDFCPGHACPPADPGSENVVFFAIGTHEAIDRVMAKRHAFSTDLQNDPVSTIRRLITIETREVPGLVGLPIDILTLSRDGAAWNQRGMCH
jgi:hypothetical protein